MTKRQDVLDKAKTCVCTDRVGVYGGPEDSFCAIAKLWTDYLESKGMFVNIEPKDVAAMLALLKIARIATGNFHEDNWVDLAGYAACGGELDAKEAAENNVDAREKRE